MQGVSHTGLGNCALNTAKVLQQNGIFATPVPVKNIADLTNHLVSTPSVTHVIISALWAATADLSTLCDEFPRTQFAVLCHSNIAFLQVEPQAIKLFRQAIDLEQSKLNFHAAGNSPVFCEAVTNAYIRPCTYLPNLYYLDHTNDPAPPPWSKGELRIGLFGAMRDQKNIASQGMAALIIATRLKVQTKLFVSTGRNDGGAATRLFNALNNLIGGTPYLQVVPMDWMSWSDFVAFNASMHLDLQVSTSESYNQVAADCMSRGIGIVVSDAITWANPHWMAKVDDATDIARVGVALLNDPSVGRDGMVALQQHNAHGLHAWIRYIAHMQMGTGALAWPANGIPLRHMGRYPAAFGEING